MGKDRWGTPKHRELTRTARDYAAVIARELPEIPWPTRVTIHHQMRDKNSTHWPDVGNIYPTVKAYIDGIVEAGKLPNDRPATVAELLFRTPVVGSRDLIVLEFEPC